MADLGRLLLAAASGGASAFADKRLAALELLEKIREEKREEDREISKENRLVEILKARELRAVQQDIAQEGRQEEETLRTERRTALGSLRRAAGRGGFPLPGIIDKGPTADILAALGEVEGGLAERNVAREEESKARIDAEVFRKKAENELDKVLLAAKFRGRTKVDIATDAARGDPEAARVLEYLNQVGVQKPLTGTAETQLINRLVKDWKVASKPAADLHRQAKLMKVGLNAARRGDMAAGSQAVLVTFQKILDPTSVVRESEYARSASGLSLVSQVVGASERLRKGGAGVPLWELETFARLAEEAVQALSTGYVTSVKNRIGLTADRYNIPRELVFEDFDFMAAEESAAGGDGEDNDSETLTNRELLDIARGGEEE